MGITHATAATGTDSGDGKISKNAWNADHYPPHKYDATAAPAVTDDSGDGYGVGSIWVDVTADKAYIAVDVTVGAAVWNPFEAAGGGGADLADFRLVGVADAPGDIPLGTYGSEFEYASTTDLATAGWAATLSMTDYRVAGSEVIFSSGDTNGRGLVFDIGGNLPDDFEVAVLLSGLGGSAENNMTGLGVVDASGNGIIFCPYAYGGYAMVIVAYVYNYTGDTAISMPTSDQREAPFWLALRRSSATTWRCRWSLDGASWTTAVAAGTRTITNARQFFIGSAFAAGPSIQYVSIHRFVYGTPDLGL